MKVSKKCLEMLAHHEGVKLKPYRDCVGLWTVGIGHLIGDGHSLPDSWNRTFTLEEVYAILAADVARFERGVERFITIPLKQFEFDALVSFSFNLGLGTLQKSTLRQKLNRSDREGALESWAKYNKAGGKIIKGLDTRRKDEINFFKGLIH